MSFDKALSEARAKCRAREMKRAPDNSDEMRLISDSDGMIDLETGGIEACRSIDSIDSVPQTREQAKKGRYLWVVGSKSVPVAPEDCPWGKNLESKVIKHSNLTGGAKAHSGGEFWFIKGEGILVNANSGRYGATTAEELNTFIEVARVLGCRVASTGFDEGNPGVPNVVPVGLVNWLDPYA